MTHLAAQGDTGSQIQQCAIRWYVEQFHREIKQLTGIERCQCRKQRIQRNYIAYALQAWVLMKKVAYETEQTVYIQKTRLLAAATTHGDSQTEKR